MKDYHSACCPATTTKTGSCVQSRLFSLCCSLPSTLLNAHLVVPFALPHIRTNILLSEAAISLNVKPGARFFVTKMTAHETNIHSNSPRGFHVSFAQQAHLTLIASRSHSKFCFACHCPKCFSVCRWKGRHDERKCLPKYKDEWITLPREREVLV
jgi:hypothetical protein